MITLKKTVLVALLLSIIIFGIVGKIIFVGIALIYDKPINLSINGIIQILIISLVIGFWGGLIRHILFLIFRISSLLRGILIGFIMFAISIIFLFAKEGSLLFTHLATFISAGLLYILFGLLLEKFLNKERE